MLAANGHEIWGTSRDVKRIPAIHVCILSRLELRDRHSIEENFNAALQEAGHFDVVINNAGSGHFGSAQLLSHEDLADFYQILVFAQIGADAIGAKSMRDHGGMIINVSSLASRLPVPFMAD